MAEKYIPCEYCPRRYEGKLFGYSRGCDGCDYHRLLHDEDISTIVEMASSTQKPYSREYDPNKNYPVNVVVSYAAPVVHEMKTEMRLAANTTVREAFSFAGFDTFVNIDSVNVVVMIDGCQVIAKYNDYPLWKFIEKDSRRKLYLTAQKHEPYFGISYPFR